MRDCPQPGLRVPFGAHAISGCIRGRAHRAARSRGRASLGAPLRAPRRAPLAEPRRAAGRAVAGTLGAASRVSRDGAVRSAPRSRGTRRGGGVYFFRKGVILPSRRVARRTAPGRSRPIEGGYTKNRKNVAPTEGTKEAPKVKRYVAAKVRADAERGTFNPEREGKILAAIREGRGASVRELIAATSLREPTVRYFVIEAARAGVIDAAKIGGAYYGFVRSTDAAASAKAFEVRTATLALVALAAKEAAARAEAEAAEAPTA